ncbi:MAG: hypothetical protein EP315_08860 [Gammaproteobacteria bacterium]|nr:MAG: hypothetical protein EP315_08860 [Gammaproteobacteria bacterium]
MAIALSSSLPIIPEYGAGRRTRDRAQTQPQTSNDTQTSRERPERVVQGEVLGARNEPRRGINSTQRTLSERDATFNTEGQSRRFSLQASVATYRQNEAIIAEPGKPRQVSGIIDEYV